MDNFNQIATLIEKYKQDGGDMSALTNLTHSLAATNKTPLGLNRWQSSDKPTMQDFNSDNEIIDRKIGELITDKADKDYIDLQLVNIDRQIQELKTIDKTYVDSQLANNNLLINGALQIWQRGTSFTAPSNAYTADRMKCTGTGTVSRTNANGGMTITGNINLRYIMEDIDYAQIDGKTVTLSYSKNGEVITDTYQSDRYDAVTGGRVVVNLDLSDCTIEWIKLGTGERAAPFISRPVADELALCQRYFQHGVSTFPLGYATEVRWAWMGDLPYKSKMRTIPTVAILGGTISGIGAINLADINRIWFSSTPGGALSPNQQAFRIDITRSGTPSLGHALIFAYRADADL